MKTQLSKIKLTFFLPALLVAFTLPAKGQREGNEPGSESSVAALESRINNLQHTFQQLSKGIDDLHWKENLSEYAFVDKVKITGPPAAKIRNPSGQGAKNPITFSAYVFIPKDLDTQKKYPLIVLPHGGVHSNFETSYTHIIRELMVQGYVVVAPDYRGSTGYGAGFYRLIDYGGLEVDDVKASRDYVVKNYSFIDQKRIGIIGWSHGGLITLMSLFSSPDSYAVGYAGAPVSDLIARMGYKTEGYRQAYSADYHIGKTAYEDVQEYRRRSPAWNTEKLQTPLLVHSTTSDEDVNVLEVEHLIKALKADNKKFEFEIYDDLPGGHHFDRIDNYESKEIRVKVYKFLSGYLKPGRPISNLDELIHASYLPKRN